jgi:hypothetical protein
VTRRRDAAPGTNRGARPGRRRASRQPSEDAMKSNHVSIGRAARCAGFVLLQSLATAYALAMNPLYAEDFRAYPDADPAARLERLFWDCERAAVTGMSLDDGLLCAEITEEFKKDRFGGDFDALLAYWRARKPHEVSTAVEQAGVAGGSDMVP